LWQGRHAFQLGPERTVGRQLLETAATLEIVLLECGLIVFAQPSGHVLLRDLVANDAGAIHRDAIRITV
jgi:hypothetical protein